MTKKELEEIHEILTDMVEGLYMDEVDIFECMWRWAKEKYHEQGPKKIGELYNKNFSNNVITDINKLKNAIINDK